MAKAERADREDTERTEVFRTKSPVASIVVINFNGRKFVADCIGSILDTALKELEVIFVDNGSSDDSVKIVQDEFGFDDRLTVIRSRRNLGYAGASNVGIKHCKGEYIFLLNNDTIVDRAWLNEPIAILERDKSVGVVQSMLVSITDNEKIDGGPSYVDVIGYGIDSGFGQNVSAFQYPLETFYANGAAIGIRRRVLEFLSPTLEAFDSQYFMYYEDVDLCWRARLIGLKVFFVPSSLVYHYKSGTSSKIAELSLYSHCKNRFATLIKNYEYRNVCIRVSQLAVFELIRAASHTVGGNWKYSLAILKAIAWNLAHFHLVYQKRLMVQKLRRQGDREIMRMMAGLQPLRLMQSFRTYAKLSSERGFIIH